MIGKRFAIFMALAMTSALATAADIKVGRTTVILPDEGWQSIALEDEGLKYGGDSQGTINRETKVFYRLDKEQKIQALLLIAGTDGGVNGSIGQMIYNPECQSNSDSYAEGNSGFRRPYLECLRVFKRFDAENTLNSLAPLAYDNIQKQNLRLPTNFQTTISRYANSNGSSLTVFAFAAPRFKGGTVTTDEKFPEKILASHVAWGRTLMDEVKSSLRSLSGTCKIPAMEFDNALDEKSIASNP
jgi:hypothetical protein